jgi:hypothetical protein
MVKSDNEVKKISQDATNRQEDRDRCRIRLSWRIGWYDYTEAHHVGSRYFSISH